MSDRLCWIAKFCQFDVFNIEGFINYKTGLSKTGSWSWQTRHMTDGEKMIIYQVLELSILLLSLCFVSCIPISIYPLSCTIYYPISPVSCTIYYSFSIYPLYPWSYIFPVSCILQFHVSLYPLLYIQCNCILYPSVSRIPISLVSCFLYHTCIVSYIACILYPISQLYCILYPISQLYRILYPLNLVSYIPVVLYPSVSCQTILHKSQWRFD